MWETEEKKKEIPELKPEAKAYLSWLESQLFKRAVQWDVKGRWGWKWQEWQRMQHPITF